MTERLCLMGHVQPVPLRSYGCPTCFEIEEREYREWEAEKQAELAREIAAMRKRVPDVLKITIVDTGEIKRFAIPRQLRRRA